MKLLVLILSALIMLLAFTFSKNKVDEIDFKNNYKFNTIIEIELANDTNPWRFQKAAAEYALKGDYRNALIMWDSGMPPRILNYSQTEKDSINAKYKLVSAHDYIIKKSKEHQIVIINEAHHNSFHRKFTRSLLSDLYKNGYRNLGLEALANGPGMDSSLNQRGYPIQKNNYYIRDPQFALMVRHAIELGFTVFAYEASSGLNGKPREIEQARNIQKIIGQRPNEKFVIHCGFAHVLEGEYKSWEKTMAGRLNEYTGIDPFTINQVAYSEKSKPEYNHKLLKALELQQSSVLIDENRKSYRYERNESWSDIAVFHASTTYLNGRPNWLFSQGIKSKKLELDEINIEYPIMALAFSQGDDIHSAIPVDIIEIEDRTKNAYLALNNGRYEVVLTNQNGKAVKMELVVD